jgi:hypothetical protein
VIFFESENPTFEKQTILAEVLKTMLENEEVFYGDSGVLEKIK